jgi:branched-chain amino acid transport system substrate-binding protein
VLAIVIVAFIGIPIVNGAATVKIAAIFPQTGDDAVNFPQAGDDPDLLPVSDVFNSFLGVRIAVDRINAGGGLLGHSLELIELDNRSSAIGAKLAAEQAVKTGVLAVIGANRSSRSLAMARVLHPAGIPMITPISTNPEVTRVGNYIFRVCITDDFQGVVIAVFAKQELKARTAVVLTNVDEKYSLDLAGDFSAHFKKYGGQVLWEGDYLNQTTDFGQLVARVKALEPDVCVIPGYSRDSAFIIKQAKQAGVGCAFLGGDGWSLEMYKYAGKAVEGGYFFDHWHRTADDERTRDFVEEYEVKRRYGRITDAGPVLSYDATMLWADAVRRSNSFEKAVIRDTLAATRNFMGVTGAITFDSERNPVGKQAVIMKFKNGAATWVKSVKP